MKASEYLIKAFENEGVNHLFMVPGMHVDAIMSALQSFPKFKAIVAGHEEGATFMADGYSKVSGKFGVAMGIGGPGITNMMTGITTAYSDKTPLFVITGDSDTAWEGRGSFQDTSSGGYNCNNFLSAVTNKHLYISHIDVFEHHVNLLFRNMLGSNRGPVHIDLPTDIQHQEVNFTPPKLPDSLYHPRTIDISAADQIWDLLKNNSKIAILAGSGALHSEATDELVKFAENYQIPVATTLGGKSVFPEDHPLSLGVLGWYGNPYAIENLLGDEIEVLIVLGSRLNQTTTLKWSKKLIPAKALIINDISENHYYANYQPDLFVAGDNRTFLQHLNRSKKNILSKTVAERKKWMEKIKSRGENYYDMENLQSDVKPIHPARVIKELREVMPKNTILFSGEGASGFIASHYWKCYEPGQHFTQVKYMSPMGWSIAAAIGGKLAKPDAPVVSIIGDGSMLMHGMEIQTAARYNIPVIFVLFNNGAHGNPQLRARTVGKFETEFLNLPIHDWAKIAEGLGLVGISVTQPDQLNAAFKKALSLNKAVLIDVRTGNYPTPVKVSPF